MNTHHQTSVLQVSIRPLNISPTLAMHPNCEVYQQMPWLHLFRHIQALYQDQQDAKKEERNKNFVFFICLFSYLSYKIC
jgi:hypothetical protein